MASRTASLLTRLTVALTVLALVGLGGAHRHGAPGDPAVAAFLQAGGSLAELCLTGDGDGPGPHGDCPACTLAKTLADTAAAPMPRPAGRLAGTVHTPPRAGLTPAHPPRAPPARGPPTALA